MTDQLNHKSDLNLNSQAQDFTKRSHEQLHFNIRTKNCISDTFFRPNHKFGEHPRHNGVRFFNEIARDKSVRNLDLYKWIFTRKSFTWGDDYSHERDRILNQSVDKPKNRPEADLNDWKIWYVGHSTILIQIGSYNFLTDPVWSDYVSPMQGIGPKRVISAGIALEQLPEIHAVLLSHNHYDHMDLASLDWLHDRFRMPIYTGLANAIYLPQEFNVVEMDWWQSLAFHDFEIIYTPAQHGSGRGLRDQNMALWGGFSLKAETGHCFFAGDTGYSPHFSEIAKRLGAPRLALLPIGAYEPRALMRYQHMNPEDAYQAHQDLNSHKSLAIHYRTFQLTDEARLQPEIDLQRVIKTKPVNSKPFLCLTEGQSLEV